MNFWASGGTGRTRVGGEAPHALPKDERAYRLEAKGFERQCDVDCLGGRGVRSQARREVLGDVVEPRQPRGDVVRLQNVLAHARAKLFPFFVVVRVDNADRPLLLAAVQTPAREREALGKRAFLAVHLRDRELVTDAHHVRRERQHSKLVDRAKHLVQRVKTLVVPAKAIVLAKESEAAAQGAHTRLGGRRECTQRRWDLGRGRGERRLEARTLAHTEHLESAKWLRLGVEPLDRPTPCYSKSG